MVSSEDIALIIIMPIMLVFWAWVVWVILEWRKIRHKSMLQSKIVDKFSTVQEFNDFIQSKEGNKFLNFLKYNGHAPREKIISSLTRGLVLLFLGIALTIIGPTLPIEWRFLSAFGIIIFALALGYLISTFISYKLIKKWGIIEEEK